MTARKDSKPKKNMFLTKVTETEMFSVPSLSDPLKRVNPKAVDPGVPVKPRVEGRNGYEVFGLSSFWGSLIANGNKENLGRSLVPKASS